ncbi:unnamed protein product (macronuclear) [Paramecium tetraurelia]|uniref:Uncharacterized protein n=1 Tax=Paramecium tetraurelia TaxID=5888 RepID=A0BJU1_PARTE|nr:uncharacterized protein GSPATT00029437001 [Paramecium tetraurelia]CAK58808.1 unnamed protein product [Paramecium tetraurelia]|eukprot:XP_001426206.1 hypothetical protein (macronuclear) [Paramecium tetraurelia strain d4-2]
MNFKQDAFQAVDSIFTNVQKSQNDRIIEALVGVREKIEANLEELDKQEEDLKVKEVFLQKIQKLMQFAEKPANLKKVWQYFSSTVYKSQDQFIELLRNIPSLIHFHLQQKVLTISMFIKQSCAELFSHSLITFQMELQHDEPIQKENIEKEDYVGCITYVSPEVQNERLYKIVMKLQGFINKIKKLDELINNSNLDSDILKFSIQNNENKERKITLWSLDDQVSYQVTTKSTLEEQPIFEQRIYLQTGMVIQLKQNFNLIVRDCGNSGNIEKKVVNEHLTPYLVGGQQVQIKPILVNDNQRWICINNGFEDVIYYPADIPIKLSKIQTLPRGIEVLLQNDGVGNYITVVGDCQRFAPRIKSKRSEGQLLQFITFQQNFNLGIIYQENIKLALYSDLTSFWNGKEIFDF